MAPARPYMGRNIRNHSTPTSTRRRVCNYRRLKKHRLREGLGALSCKNDLSSAFLNVDGLSDAKLDDVASFVTAKSPDFFLIAWL